MKQPSERWHREVPPNAAFERQARMLSTQVVNGAQNAAVNKRREARADQVRIRIPRA